MELSRQPEFEKALVAALSEGLPLTRFPYRQIAAQLKTSEARVLDGIKQIIERGVVKRFGVVVRHRELGYRANGMVVWDVDDDKVNEVGHCIGQYSFVTLCYQRPRRLPSWPYNLFCMIHGLDRQAVIDQVAHISEQCGLQRIKREILFSTRCFKQRGASYSKKPHMELNELARHG